MRDFFTFVALLFGLTVSGAELSDSLVMPVDTMPKAVTDSVPSEQISTFGKKVDKFTSSRFYQMTYVGVPLIIGGLIVKGEDAHFRNLRKDYLPEFRQDNDYCLQYLPAAVMYGMKAFGVESRSSWGRMLVSDLASVAVMGTLVSTLKRTTQVERPDGSNKHSFPSGHTATAFMTATMLTKEYGHKSPWVGIGAYSVASAMGLMRIADNKHWLSDVLAGAGIGILSTELGYYVADLIFKEKGLRHVEENNIFNRMDSPSFIGLYLGANVPLSHYDIEEGKEFRTSSGSVAGLEGAYFLNPYFGFGGRFAVSNTSIIVNREQAEENTFDAVAFSAGSYFSYPFSHRWNIGSKLLVGYVHYPTLKLKDQTIASNGGLTFGSGVALSFKARKHYGMRFFLDYNLQPSHRKGTREWMNTLVLGTAFVVTFR